MLPEIIEDVGTMRDLGAAWEFARVGKPISSSLPRWTGTDAQLLQRPGKGWTPWKPGSTGAEIERAWREARVLHFPKLNCSAWFDGSDHVGIALWGVYGDWWTMRKPSTETTLSTILP